MYTTINTIPMLNIPKLRVQGYDKRELSRPSPTVTHERGPHCEKPRVRAMVRHSKTNYRPAIWYVNRIICSILLSDVCNGLYRPMSKVEKSESQKPQKVILITS